MTEKFYTDKLRTGVVFLVPAAFFLIAIFNFREMDIVWYSKYIGLAVFGLIALFGGLLFFKFKPILEFDGEQLIERGAFGTNRYFFKDISRFELKTTYTRSGRSRYIYIYFHNSPKVAATIPLDYVKADPGTLVEKLNAKIGRNSA